MDTNSNSKKRKFEEKLKMTAEEREAYVQQKSREAWAAAEAKIANEINTIPYTMRQTNLDIIEKNPFKETLSAWDKSFYGEKGGTRKRKSRKSRKSKKSKKSRKSIKQ